MNKVVLEVMHRLRGITGNEEQGFVSGRSWKEPIYAILFKGEVEGDDLPDCNEETFTPVDYIRKRRKDDHQFLAWARIRTDKKDESKLDAAIWDTVIKTINFCQCQDSDQGDVVYLMAITTAIDEIIKHTKRVHIVDLRALEMANSMLIDQYLNDIYTKQKFILNSVSGATITKLQPPLYQMPKTPEFNMLEAGNIDRYLEFMKTKDKRFKIILEEVIRQERKLDGSRFGAMFLDDTVRFNLVDANEKVEEKYKLDYVGWAETYRVDYPYALSDENETYRPILKVLYYSHAICDAIGKMKIFNTNGFKMLLDEAQEVLVYSRAHFKMSGKVNDDQYSSIVKEAHNGISNIENVKFEMVAISGKDGNTDDLVSRLTIVNDSNKVCINIKVNKAAFQLAYVYVKHELNIGSHLVRDVICLSLLSHAAHRYLVNRPLSSDVDGWDIRAIDKVESAIVVPFTGTKEGAAYAAKLIDDIGGLCCTVEYTYQSLEEF